MPQAVMPKAVKVSLKDITKAIEKARKELAAASNKTRDRATKRKLSKKRERLKAIEAQVKILCPPVRGSLVTHFVVVPLQ